MERLHLDSEVSRATSMSLYQVSLTSYFLLVVLIFLSVFNYLIDGYTIFAASVLAANAILRSLFGFAFPLFTS